MDRSNIVVMVLVLIFALLVLLAVTAPVLGVDSRPTGMQKWGDPREFQRSARF